MRFRLRTTALTTLAVGLVALSPQLPVEPAAAATKPARVAVNEYRAVPSTGKLTVRGHGYGHGRGMSQYGARGAARSGLDHEQILAFYYPGTKLEKADRPIKVLVTADTTDDLVVVNSPGLKVHDLGVAKSYELPQNLRAKQWRIVADSKNRNVVQYLVGSSWKSWSPGGSKTLRGTGEFRGVRPTTLVTPRGAVTYRGWLRAAKPTPTSTRRDTVNVVGLDSYVKGVVAAEMPASWEAEAVQSQSVAARTYGVFHRERSADRYFHVGDTTAYQVYGGVTREHPLGNAAVAATSKQILTYKGKPAFTEFSSSSGGWTVASDIPYQVAEADPYDDVEGNSNHEWTTTLTRSTVQRAYPSLGTLRGVRVTQRDGNGAWGGRVLRVVLDGSRSDIALSGDQLRIKFGLKSTWLRF